MPPERSIRKELAPSPAPLSEPGKNDRSRAAVEAFALGVGAASAAVLKSSDAEAGDAAFVGRNQYLDRIALDTGAVTSSTPFGSSQAVLYGAQVIQPSSGDSYIVLSVYDPINGDKLIKATDLDAATPTLDILPEPVSRPVEIHVNVEEGVFSVPSGGTGESLLCQIDNSDICERYATGVSYPLSVIFDNISGFNPTLISIDSGGGNVATFPLAPDADGDGFPEPSPTGEIPSDTEILGSTSGPMAFYFDDATKVLTVGTLNDKQIHAMDLDTNSGTPSILTRYDTLFTTLRPTDIVDTGTGGLVVLGHNGGGTGYRASFTIGVDASTLTPNIPEASFGGGSRVGNYQSGAMNSDGNLVVLHTNWDQLRTYDLSFNQVGGPFSTGGFGIENVIVVYQASPTPPPDLDGDGSPDSLDCAPSDATVFPGAPELCDGVANDCDAPSVPSDELDSDGDGITECEGDCNPSDSAVYPGAPEPSCGGPDLNCDEIPPPTCPDDIDDDGDGLTENQGDCDDGNASISPAAPEICGGGSEDCDPEIDEPGAQGEETVWPDQDGDGSGAAGVGIQACPGIPGTVGQDGDCNDDNAAIHPGASELTGIPATDDDCANGTDLPLDGTTPAIPGVNNDSTPIGISGNFIWQGTENVTVSYVLAEGNDVATVLLASGFTQGDLTAQHAVAAGPVGVILEGPGVDLALYDTIGSMELEDVSGNIHVTLTILPEDGDHFGVISTDAYGTLQTSLPEGETAVFLEDGTLVSTTFGPLEDEVEAIENPGDDDDVSPNDDDSGDDDSGSSDDDSGDDDDVTPDDDDTTEEVLDDDSDTSGDDDSAIEEPGCQESGCSMTIQNLDGSTNIKGELAPAFGMTVLLMVLAARIRRSRTPARLLDGLIRVKGQWHKIDY